MSRIILGAGALVAVAGTTPPAEAAIFGDDDRRDVYDHPSQAWRDLASSSVMMMLNADWRICGPDFVPATPGAVTLGVKETLCEGEAFADQPVVAGCSGVLVAPDLVATAGHCLTDETCPRTAFAAGVFHSSPGTLQMPALDDVYACREIMARSGDIALLRLDRPVPGPYVPAVTSATEPLTDDNIGIVGFPSGMPMKIATNCKLFETGNKLLHNCDTFPGNSGSGIWNAELELIGITITGTGNYKPNGDCNVAMTYTEDGLIEGVPSQPQLAGGLLIRPAIDQLCLTNLPSSLCGGAAACGDGICSDDETTDSCSADCAPSTCGDGYCAPTTELDCSEDCGFLTACGSEGGAGGGGDGPSGGRGGAGVGGRPLGEGGDAGAHDGSADAAADCSCRVVARPVHDHGPWAWLMVMGLCCLRKGRRQCTKDPSRPAT